MSGTSQRTTVVVTHTLHRRGPDEHRTRGTVIGMKIEITVTSLDPPLGWITCRADEQPTLPKGDRALEFVGWLGLLRVLDDLIGAPGRSPIRRDRASRDAGVGGG